MALCVLNALRGSLRSATSKSKSMPLRPIFRSFSTADDFGVYTGDKKIPFVTEIPTVMPDELPTYPAYRVMDDEGNIVKGATDPKLGKELCLKIYENMVRLNNMDKVRVNPAVLGSDFGSYADI